MQASHVGRWVETVTVALLVGAVCCVATALWFRPEPTGSVQVMEPQEDSGGGDEAVAEALVRMDVSLAELRQWLERPRLQREPGPSALDQEALAVVAERVEALERSVEAALAAPADSSESVPRGLAPDWSRLGELQAWRARDHAAAKASVALMTVHDVIRRFGTPSRVSERDGLLRLTFLQGNPSEATGYVSFEFAGGFVCYLESNMGDP